MMTRVALWFNGDVNPELVTFSLSHPLLSIERTCSRGKTGGAQKKNGSFQWTPAVQALAIFFLQAASESAAEKVALRGFYGSPATSLDFAINKQPVWLLDMFGVTTNGTCLVNRIISRTNPGSKRPGPVELSLNESVLPSEHIEIYVNGSRVIESASLRKLSRTIELTFQKTVVRRAKPRGRDDSDGTSNPPHFLPLNVEQVSHYLHPTHLLELKARVLSHSTNPWVFPEILGPESKERLLSIFEREVVVSYQNGSGLRSSNFEVALNQFVQADSCRHHFGKIPTNLCAFVPPTSDFEALGIANDHAEFSRALASEPPLEFAVCGTNISAVCLLYFLKYVRGFNIKLYSGSYGHAQALLSTILNGGGPLPDGVIMGITQSLALLRSSKNPGFRYLMEFPKTPHRAVSSLEGDDECSRIFGYHDTPVYLNQAQAEGTLSKLSTKIETGEHAEIVDALWAGDPEMRAFLWFPHYTLYELLNTHRVRHVPASPERSAERSRESTSSFLASTVCLSLHKSVFERNRAHFLLITLRDAWLSLLENPTLRRFLIRLVVEDFQLPTVLFRGAALHRAFIQDDASLKAL